VLAGFFLLVLSFLKGGRHMKKLLVTTVLLLACAVVPAYGGLPDTGQTKCYDNTQEIACPQPGQTFYGQDAQYGPNLQSFTDLDNGIVRDNVTGLEWQQATAPGSYKWQQAVDYCASLNLGGHDDWRLPTVKELSTLVDSSYYVPAINTTYFPNTQSGFDYCYYWSSTTNANDPYVAWYVEFGGGGVYNLYKGYSLYVRAVRGGQSGLFENSFIDNGDGTVTDTSTGLMWQQATDPGFYAWEQALAYCENLNLGGHDDWRLPNRNELQSLADYSRYFPAIDTGFFPDIQFSFLFLSSTTHAHCLSDMWFVGFDVGSLNINWKGDSRYYVRAVRAGQCGSLGDSDIDGVCDDGDNSSIVGDNLCTGGQAEICDDNCPSIPNGPHRGTCVKDVGGVLTNTGVICYPGGTECATGQTCQLTQGDMNSNGIGDACECYADFNNSGKVNLTDLTKLKSEFGRTNCTSDPVCIADANDDNKVNLTDLGLLKSEFGKTNCPIP
jgi:hypothetical protein